MNLIKRILHLLPFVHFYGRWEDLHEPSGYGHWHQVRRCTVCNRGQIRWTEANPFK